MTQNEISGYFSAFGWKRLSAHEIDPEVSHGHEFQGVGKLREIFGTSRREIMTSLKYSTDDPESCISSTVRLTWYDAREKNPDRAAEWRLYYDSDAEPVLASCNPGDLAVIVRHLDGTHTFIIAEAGSTTESQICWLFGIDIPATDPGNRQVFGIRQLDQTSATEPGFAASRVLELFGISPVSNETAWLEEMVRRFGTSMPANKALAEYACETLPGLDSRSNPDDVLLQRIHRQETLFRLFEKKIFEPRILQGFSGIDEFVSSALSLLNSRKSRAGSALELHAAKIFDEHNIRYTMKPKLEHGVEPDFLFPGIKEYYDPNFDPNRLIILGAKTTCKDRWRQVLSEGAHAKHKYLLTFEPSISIKQTDQMKAHGQCPAEC